MLELIGAFVVTGFGGLFAEQHRFLVQEDVSLLWFDAQTDISLRFGPHLEGVLQQ